MKRSKIGKLVVGCTLLLASVFMFSACSKSDDDTTTPTDGTVKVQYRVIGSAGVKISVVVFGENGDFTSDTSDKTGTTWTSKEVTVEKAYAMVTANASGPANNSTLKCQILQGGKVVKDGNVNTGPNLSASVSLF
ncbi:hypothetical protein LZQ00_11215 [Sphingobacterium sp. SRCM116780]|uniref:hypothetical protein n=1 Tax=Sphingobacterium sp. SRCM116780 TaxID=2907623 RepID=UPI001F322D9C|nr:hypothetical protein [Sphingobacterium sp. SRCM116780]UIR54847.1 hypothetical protein LZQ00_11215 [Sphingobacterium sp. SRCM116780]